jgi:hypothetical protein
MPLVLNLKHEESIMINGELLITARFRKGKISLEFLGPEEKYNIWRADKIRERAEESKKVEDL